MRDVLATRRDQFVVRLGQHANVSLVVAQRQNTAQHVEPILEHICDVSSPDPRRLTPRERQQRPNVTAIRRLERRDVSAAGFGYGDEIGAAPGEAVPAETLREQIGGET